MSILLTSNCILMDGENLVSICVITYNQEAYISETLDSLLAQKTNFRFRIFIGEDKSKDNTRSICEDYARRYADKIELLPSDRNYGMMGNFIRTLEACNGRYTAVCEGDDYWVDDYKLQKQFDLLESNPDKVLCFTKSYLVNDKGERTGDNVGIPIKSEFTFEDVLKTARFFIPTATLFFRNDLPKPFPPFFHHTVSGDIALCLMLLQKGNGLCLYEETAVYRHHGGGITKTQEHIDHAFLKLFKTYEDLNEYYEYKLDHVFRRQLFEMSKTMLMYGSKGKKGVKKLKHAAKSFSLYFKYQPRLDIKEVVYYTNVLFFSGILKVKKKFSSRL